MTTRTRLRNPAEYRRVLERMNELHRNTGDFTPAMRATAEFLLNRTEESFAREAAPDGTPWKPLAPSTQRERQRLGKDGPILQRDRNLLNSLDSSYDGRSAAVGTNLIYARIHQFGGEIQQSGRQQVLAFAARGGRFASRASTRRRRAGAVRVSFAEISARTISIPARPFLGAAPGDENALLDIVERHLAR